MKKKHMRMIRKLALDGVSCVINMDFLGIKSEQGYIDALSGKVFNIEKLSPKASIENTCYTFNNFNFVNYNRLLMLGIEPCGDWIPNEMGNSFIDEE